MAKSFEVIEKVGLSEKCYCDAAEQIVLDFNKTHKVSWFEITEQRGRVTDKGKIEFQVTVKIGFKE